MLLNHCPGFQLGAKNPMQLSCFRWWREILLNFKGCLDSWASISSSIKKVWARQRLSGRLSSGVNEDIVFPFMKRSGLFLGFYDKAGIFQQIEGMNTLIIFWQNILKAHAYSVLQRCGSLWKRSQVSCLSRRSINCDYTRMALIQRMNGSLQGNFQSHNPEWLFHSSFLIRERPGWRFLLWNASKGPMALGV